MYHYQVPQNLPAIVEIQQSNPTCTKSNPLDRRDCLKIGQEVLEIYTVTFVSHRLDEEGIPEFSYSYPVKLHYGIIPEWDWLSPDQDDVIFYAYRKNEHQMVKDFGYSPKLSQFKIYVDKHGDPVEAEEKDFKGLAYNF